MFRPGQLAFFQLKAFVSRVVRSCEVKGTLRLRDGLPLIDPTGNGAVEGVLLYFDEHRAEEAYKRVADLEPESHYRWERAKVDHIDANALFGVKPRKGSIECEGDWNSWNDPLFTSALEVVKETLIANQNFEWNLKPLFRLQMAYLLLWSAVERYVSLRYHLGKNATFKVNCLASESAFAEALQEIVKESREVYRADEPDEKIKLEASNPKKSLKYYYQIRSNITHRGKAVVRDHERVLEAGAQLHEIFTRVLDAARLEAAEVIR